MSKPTTGRVTENYGWIHHVISKAFMKIALQLSYPSVIQRCQLTKTSNTDTYDNMRIPRTQWGVMRVIINHAIKGQGWPN